MLRRELLVGVAAALIAAGCGGSPTGPGPVTPPPDQPPPPPPPPAPVYTLGITRILTFGDSMTDGTVSAPAAKIGLDPGRMESYPFKLQALLSARYNTQTVSVFNAGVPGESTYQARQRLVDNIKASAPQLVILLEGANDLNSISGIDMQNAAVDVAVGNMEDLVRDTVGRGIPVFLATLPPQHLPKGTAGPLLSRYNDGLRVMAAKKGATIIDLNAMFPVSLIGSDGLHPTEPGYQLFAEIFFDAIKQRYETTPSAARR